MELRVVQYKETTPIDGELVTGLIKFTRYVLQYRHVDWGEWKDVPIVECEEGSEPDD